MPSRYIPTANHARPRPLLRGQRNGLHVRDTALFGRHASDPGTVASLYFRTANRPSDARRLTHIAFICALRRHGDQRANRQSHNGSAYPRKCCTRNARYQFRGSPRYKRYGIQRRPAQFEPRRIERYHAGELRSFHHPLVPLGRRRGCGTLGSHQKVNASLSESQTAVFLREAAIFARLNPHATRKQIHNFYCLQIIEFEVARKSPGSDTGKPLS